MVVVAFLRGVNVGPHHRIRMEPLRALYESLGLTDVRTLLQSGNVLFRFRSRNLNLLAKQIEAAFAAQFGFHSAVFLRSADELRAAAAGNPFSQRTGLDPAKLAVTFLGDALNDDHRVRLAALQGIPEELHAGSRELFIYYTAGMARPSLTGAMLDKALSKMPTTTRNWNTVTKLLQTAAEMEAER